MKKAIAFLLLLCTSIASATTLVPVQILNPTGSTSGQIVLSNGPVAAPGWGNVAATSLAVQAANTVVANVTGSSASPTAFPMPSCTGATNALGYTSGTGIVCNGSINAATLGGATFAAPGPIGSTAASSGAFTTLAASGTVSGTGFSNYLASPPAIGGTTAGSGAFTTLGASGILTSTNATQSTTSANGAITTAGGIGVTGNINVGGTITGGGTVTGVTGAFTNVTTSGTITPTYPGGVVGNKTGSNVTAGSVGEYLTNTTSGTSMTTSGSSYNCTSLSLTAGDWDVSGSVQFVPAAGTTVSGIDAGISTTSATLGALGSLNTVAATLTTSISQYQSTPVVRENVSGTTTVYLVGQASFGTSTMTCNGFIEARRR